MNKHIKECAEVFLRDQGRLFDEPALIQRYSYNKKAEHSHKSHALPIQILLCYYKLQLRKFLIRQVNQFYNHPKR